MTRITSWRQFVAGPSLRPPEAGRWPAVAAVVEAGTGLVLVVSPSLFIWLLFGADLSEAGRALGRLAGFALVALGLACWPVGQAERRTVAALCAMLIYSALATIYLLYLAVVTDLVGMLLWPAVAVHAALTVLLARTWVTNRGGGNRRRRGPANGS